MGNVLLCMHKAEPGREERKEFRTAHFLPGPHYSQLMGLQGSEQHGRGAGVGYSFDLLDQSLLQT